MNIKTACLIDVGNSETRVQVLSNKQRQDFTFSNRFAEIMPNYRVPKEYVRDGNDSMIFVVNDTPYANGNIVSREFEHIAIRPAALQDKSAQIVTELSFNMVFARLAMQFSKEQNCAIDQLDLTFNVCVLLPPMEESRAHDDLVKKIKAIQYVTVKTPVDFVIPVKYDVVDVYPECIAGFFGAMYEEVDNALVEVEANKKFLTGYTFATDIGAGTTDVAIFLDGELVSRSKDTYEIGGNFVAGIVSKEIRQQYGVTYKDMESAIETASITIGNDVIDISKIVTAAKQEFSMRLMQDIRTYLETLSISPKLIKGLLVMGGGSLASVNKGTVVSPAMADVMIDYFKDLAPNISRVEIPNGDARKLNLDGLRILYKYM